MSNWNGSSRLTGADTAGLLDLKSLLNQALAGGSLAGLTTPATNNSSGLSSLGSGFNNSTSLSSLGSGLSNNLSPGLSPLNSGVSGGGISSCQNRYGNIGSGSTNQGSRPLGGNSVIGQGSLANGLGNLLDSTNNGSSSSSFFDPFSSMQGSFGFFNPKDPSSNLPLSSSSGNSSSFMGGNLGNSGYHADGNQHRGGNSSNNMSHIGQMGASKSPTYHHSNTGFQNNSHSPVFGQSHSPTFFGGSGSSQHNHFSSSNSNNYAPKFPISTFSLDDTIQARNDENSSIFCSDDLTSSNGSNHFGGSSSSHYMGNNNSGTSGNSSRGRDRENAFNSNNRTNDSSENSSGYQGARETGIIEKLLHSYGFIQCCERQARLFFHFSQFDGTIEHLKLGDPVEFEMTYDRRTGKPIASAVTKIGPEVVLSEERVTGTVTTELHHESNGELQGRISYENRGECFFLPYCQEDIEGNVSLRVGDTVSFQIATNQRSGNLTARYVRLENPARPVRYRGIVSSIKDSFGFIERADVAKEIFFHFSETRVQDGIVVGDNVEFNIQTRNGKEVACSISKLAHGTVVFEDIGCETLKGQILKPIDRAAQQNAANIVGPTPRSESMLGRLRYRGPDRQELEVVFGDKDQKGTFTMRHGDWVQFQLAVDRRDKQQRATHIILLEESFTVSGERREEGVIEQICKEGYGYITCAERDTRVFFRLPELLDQDRTPKVSDDVEYTIVQDSSSPTRQSAIRVKYLAPGSVRFETLISPNVCGVVVREPSTPWVSQEAVASILPSLHTLGLPANVTEKIIQGLNSAETSNIETKKTENDGRVPGGFPGVLQYQINGWQVETINFNWTQCRDLKNIRQGKKVTFDLTQSRRTREFSATNIVAASVEGENDITGTDAQPSVVPEPVTTPPAQVQGSPRYGMQVPVTSSVVTSSCDFISSSSTTKSDSSPSSGGANSVNSQSDSGVRTLSDASGTPGLVEFSDPSAGEDSDSVADEHEELKKEKNNEVFSQGERMVNGTCRSKSKDDLAHENSSNSSSPPSYQRVLLKGYIAALKDGFGFIETLAQDGEIFFHISSLVGGDFSTLEVGQEVEYTVTAKNHGGKIAADIVKPLPKGSIGRAAIFPEILSGTVSRPLRGGANPDQSEYTGVIDAVDGERYSFGIISLLNKKDTLQSGDPVEFQLDAQEKPVNIRPIRKRLRSTVEAVKGQYGFLAHELEDGKKLFFHMSEVRDHQHLNPGDEVEFVILQNSRNGKCSAGSVVKIGTSATSTHHGPAFKYSESQRPERLLNRVSKLSVDESSTRYVVVRQPYGPDGSRGFTYNRQPRKPGTLIGNRDSVSSSGSNGATGK